MAPLRRLVEQMPNKALVIRDDKNKFKDIGDVVAVARSQGKTLFKTKENVYVIRVCFDRVVGWIAVVSLSPLNAGCSNTLVVSEGEKNEK